MIISLRFAAVIAFAWVGSHVAAAPLPNTKANYEPPTATFQMVAGQKLVLEAALYCTNVFDKETNERISEQIKTMKGSSLFAGLDLTRPVAAYLYLRPRPSDSACVFVVPITEEKAALESLSAIGLEVAKEDKAAKTVTFNEIKTNPWSPFAFLNGVAPVLRFHDKCAYIALHNGSSEVLANPDKLIPLNDLVNAKEPAQIAGTLHFDRFPKELQKPLFDLLNEGQQGVAQLQQRAPADMPKGFPPFAQQILIWCQRNLAASFADGDTLNAKFMLDGKAGDHDLQLSITPKAKSPLAADVTAVKKANGRFAQLLTNEAAAGMSMTLPKPIAQEVRSTAGVFLSDWVQLELGRNLPIPGLDGPIADLVNKQVTAGDADVAGAVYGPDKDGNFTALAAVAITNHAATEKAIKAALKDAPKEVTEKIQWEAVKVGDTKAHTVDLMDGLPDEFKKTFGEKSKLHVAFTKDAAYVAIGPDAVTRMEKAMALKPADAVAFNVAIHKEKFQPLMTTMGGREFPIHLAAKNELIPVYRVDIHGGESFHVKVHLGMILFFAVGRGG